MNDASHQTRGDDDSNSSECQAGIPAWPKDALRVSFGIIWLIDAILKWLPGFRSAYMGTIMGQAQGSPAGSSRGSASGPASSTRRRCSSPTWSPRWKRRSRWPSSPGSPARSPTCPRSCSACRSGRPLRDSADPAPQAPPTSALRSSTQSCSPGCSRSATTPARPVTAPTTTWSRRSPGGGGSPRCATRRRPRPHRRPRTSLAACPAASPPRSMPSRIAPLAAFFTGQAVWGTGLRVMRAQHSARHRVGGPRRS